MLATLAGDSRSSVRGCVARQPGTPPEVLATLTEDPMVRQVVTWARDWPRDPD